MKSTLTVAAVLAALTPSYPLLSQAPTPAAARQSNPKPTSPPQLPPPGIAIPEKDRAELSAGVAELGRLIAGLRADPKKAALLPDVEIFHKAVDWPLRYNEFYNVKEVPTAKKLLAIGKERAEQLAKGEHPWTAQTGFVVRGYRSRVDDSVQPYGLIVPANWKQGNATPLKSLVWLLGRGNTRTELAFINERLAKAPEITCPDGITIIPYGRFCNATKFAGESDVFEALAHTQKHFTLDPARTAVAGFSMGGASAWHLGAHHAGMWCFVAPGAGFAETREYAKVFSAGKTPPPWWEQVLWRWYDATEYAANLSNVPTIAYSGELDKQIQATQIMMRFAEKEGVQIEHFIGPKTEHKYEPETKKKLQARLAEIWQKPKLANPQKFRWVTYTPIYGGPDWLKIKGLEQPWERAEVQYLRTGNNVQLTTTNVRSLQWRPLVSLGKVAVTVDGQSLPLPTPTAGGDARPLQLRKTNGKWQEEAPAASRTLEKNGHLSGPIDHAFMSRFIFVRPTGKPMHDKVGAWTQREMEHAKNYWRQIFRAEPIIKADTEVSADDLAQANLVLWGDPLSNQVLQRIAAKLPITWTKEKLEFGGQSYDATKTAPVMIYPNPLSSTYVVINSGITMREASMGTNSQQTPKLPDWAIVDLDTPPGPEWPGKILDAGFFDVMWRHTPQRPSTPK
jgi:hypothetical protein